jgi:NodT family efflux transporter outer membrane factor (OMF) lipoprotein
MRLATLVMLALAGCTLGPGYVAPVPPAPLGSALPYVPAGLATRAEVEEGWWRRLRDPALDRLVERALLANTDLRVAQSRVEGARAAFRSIEAARLPSTQMSLGAAYGRSATTDQIAGALGREADDTLLVSAGAEAGWEVDLSGRIRRAIEAGRADAEAVEAARDAIRVAVVATVVQGYAASCAIGSQIAVAREAVAIADEARAIVSRQLDAGGASRFDLARQDALASRTRATIPVLEGERRAVLFALAASLGETPEDVPAEASACTRVPELAAAIPVGDAGDLIARRPDVREAERRVAGASARTGVARADLVPRVSILAGIGSVAPAIDALGAHATTNFHIGPFLSWSFPNLAIARARVRQAEAADREAIAAYQGSVLGALRELEQALARYAGTRGREDELNASMEQARTAYRLAGERLDAGSISRLELLTAQQALIEAQLATSEARLGRSESIVAVFRALGGG